MKNVIKYNRFLSLTAVFAVIVTWYLYFFGHAVLSPNSVMHSADQDGLKNYYTFAYQSAYSNESWKFEGMNYPYGEHVIYTDGQPLFGFLFGWLPIKGYEVGLLNMIMYLSILLAAFLVWKILITLKVSNWTAAAGTIGIVLLSPQFYRLGGHYALSIMWVIPLVLYQLIKLWDSDAVVKRSVLLSVTIFTLFFIHPYLGLMSLVFSVITILIYLLVRQFHLKKALGTLLIIGCSAILFKLTLSLTDTHLNRTEKPHGLFEHYALAETVFLPYFSPFKPMMERVIPVKHGQPFEGWGYIGLMSILVLSGSIIYWIIRMLKGNKSEFKKKDLVLPVFFASVIVLLFSMLIPLKWFPEEFVYKLKVFNQFRSVGRFSWVFYYVTGITVIVLLDRFSRTNSAWKRISATCLIVLFPLMNMAESWEAYKFFCTQNGKSPNLFLEKNLSTKKDWNQVLEKIRQEKDAVILPLPFFHIGSEHAMRGGTTEIQQLTMVMSYHSGLPTVGSFLSRTSVTETISIFKMLAPEKNEGGLPKGIDGKDLLILTTQQPLDQYEEQILKASEPMYIGESIGLYRLKFKDYQKQAQKQLSMRMKNSLVIDPAFIKNKGESDSSILILNDFEGLKSEHVFAGSGALKVQKKVYSFLATVPSRGIDTLTASFWYYKGKSGLYNAMVIVEEIDTVTNAGQWKLVTDANRSPIFRDDWVLVEVPIMMREGNFKYNLLIVGPPESKEHFYIDNLMVRKSSNDYLIKLPEWCPSAYQTYFNNLPFHR